MRKGFLSSLAALLAGAGVVVAADEPAASPEPPAVIQTAPADMTTPQALVPEPERMSAAHDWTEPPADWCGEPACPARGRCWASAEHLLWWVKDAPVPVPLVTSSTAADDLAGLPGHPGTGTVIGGRNVGLGTFSGGRLTLGSWLNRNQTFGVEARGFLLERQTTTLRAASDATGSPATVRPFFDVLTADAFPFSSAFPGSFVGGDVVSLSTRLWGAEVNGVLNRGGGSTQLLAGFRYLDLQEDLHIAETSQVLNSTDLTFGGFPVAAGGITNTRDHFQTRNQFYGGQLGARRTLRRGNASLALSGKVALGATHQSANVLGVSSLGGPGVTPAAATGGVLAVPANSGRFTRDEFSVIPELEAQVGYQLTSYLRAFVGYNFLYWTNVARPGEIIATRGGLPVTNRGQIPTSGGFGLTGATGPATVLNSSDFWAQGVNFGLEFRY